MAPLCAVSSCIGAPIAGVMTCATHAGAKRAVVVMAGTKCTACRRVMKRDDWITRDSSAAVMTHATCPPASRPLDQKKDRPKPLLEAADLEQPF